MTSLVGKLETQVKIKASAKQFHHMFSERPYHVSKVTPGNVQSCELHQGVWGKVGSIIIWKYVHDKEEKVMKERIEAVDLEKNLIKLKVIEADTMKEYKSFVVTLQVSPKLEGHGSIAQWIVEYEKISEEVAHPKTFLQLCHKISKDVDEYLLNE